VIKINSDVENLSKNSSKLKQKEGDIVLV